MTKRFALFRGKKGYLVGHPGQSLSGARYICQRELPRPVDGLKGFGEPGYSGPEIADLYEPTIELHELTALNRGQLEKAVRAGHLDRSEIMVFPDQAAAEKARGRLAASLVERKERAAREAVAAREAAAKDAAARADNAAGANAAEETERALLEQLAALDVSIALPPPAVLSTDIGEPVPPTERPAHNGEES